ncbi:MAG: DUF937 domain-containing protein [Pirellula sp.]|jgi:OOP family OmpA-OmpF porin
MAINLLDMVKSAVAGQVAEQLSSAVGIDKSKASSAIDAVAPVLLGGLLKKASTPSGASDLSKMFKEQDTSILDNLGGLLGGGGSSSGVDLMSMGAKFLPMLLGSSQGSVISALVKLLGFNEKSITSLITMLAPIVMSVVGKQAKSMGALDPSALTSLLGSQSNLLSSALPKELSGVMGLADVLGGKANAAVQAATQATQEAANPLKWLLPLGIVGLLGFLGWQLLNNKPAEQTDKKGSTPSAVSAGGADVQLPSLPDLTDVKKGLDTTFGGLTQALSGITDVDTAKGALSKIEDAAKAYAGLGIDKLPAAAQTGLGPFIKPYVNSVKELLEKLYIIPGVKDVIEPAIGPMLETVNKLVG